MIFIRLFFEFAKVGLFAVGGGLATIPFLQDMGARTGWFTDVDLTTMIAVSESTPMGPGVKIFSDIFTKGLVLFGVILYNMIQGFQSHVFYACIKKYDLETRKI